MSQKALTPEEQFGTEYSIIENMKIHPGFAADRPDALFSLLARVNTFNLTGEQIDVNAGTAAALVAQEKYKNS